MIRDAIGPRNILCPIPTIFCSFMALKTDMSCAGMVALGGLERRSICRSAEPACMRYFRANRMIPSHVASVVRMNQANP